LFAFQAFSDLIEWISITGSRCNEASRRSQQSPDHRSAIDIRENTIDLSGHQMAKVFESWRAQDDPPAPDREE